jgi:hypothetical protein
MATVYSLDGMAEEHSVPFMSGPFLFVVTHKAVNHGLVPWPVRPQETTAGNTLVHQLFVIIKKVSWNFWLHRNLRLKCRIIKLKSNHLLTIVWQNFQIEFEFKLVEVRASCWHIDILQLGKSPAPSLAKSALGEGGQICQSQHFIYTFFVFFIWSIFNVALIFFFMMRQCVLRFRTRSVRTILDWALSDLCCCATSSAIGIFIVLITWWFFSSKRVLGWATRVAVRVPILASNKLLQLLAVDTDGFFCLFLSV